MKSLSQIISSDEVRKPGHDEFGKVPGVAFLKTGYRFPVHVLPISTTEQT